MTLYAYSFPRRIARRWMAESEANERGRYLAVDVRDVDDAFIVSALVPGLKPDDLSIQILDDVVSIEGKMPEVETEGYLLHELPAGSFRRELRLPAPLDAEKVEAKIADGILTVRLPKAESARPRNIKIITK